MAIFFDTEGAAKTSVGTRTEVWLGFECPFKGDPSTQVMCGNWCALFEEEAYEGTIASSTTTETRKRATLKCGAGTKAYAEVVTT